MSSGEEKCYDAFYKGRKNEGLELLHKLKDRSTVDRITVHGFSLLHTVAYQGWLDVAKELITEYKCEVDRKTSKNKTPLFFACRQGNEDVVKYLLATGKCDLSVKSRGGNTPITVALREKHYKIVEFLNKFDSTCTISKDSSKSVVLGQPPPLPAEAQNTTVESPSCLDNQFLTDHAVNTMTTLTTATSLVDDTPLTVSDLVPVLRATVEVTDWYSLGLELGLPVHQLDTIRRDGYDEADRKRKMSLNWMDTGVASWSSLVEALKSPLVNKEGVAEQITKDHPRTLKRKGEQRQLEEEEGTEENQSKKGKLF